MKHYHAIHEQCTYRNVLCTRVLLCTTEVHWVELIYVQTTAIVYVLYVPYHTIPYMLS